MPPTKTRISIRTLSLLFAAMLTVTTGCLGPHPADQERETKGRIVVLPGVEGQRWQLGGVTRGLRDAGIDYAIEIIPWGTPPFHSLQNLVNLRENRKRAERFAQRITELRRAAPNAPLTLVGYSGGGGLAVFTLEALPDDVAVDRVILVAAAISNDYDLSNVRPHVREQLVNIYSDKDPVVGVGTKTFGTIDRKHALSAGHFGLRTSDGELLTADWITQIPWKSDWIPFGHFGGHIGYLSRRWAREILAPQITAAGDSPANVPHSKQSP